jgi:uncharacterized membrane protein
MKYDFYPAIYKAADNASIRTQRYYLNCIRGYIITVIIGVGLGVYGITSKSSALFAAIIFLLGIFISILIHYRHYENIWYKCRAIAESVKTSSWRYIMKANPFEDSNNIEIVNKEFLNLIQNILEEHKNLAAELTVKYGTSEQITEEMKEVRSMDLTDRIKFYRDNRIDEQRLWYAKKALENKKKGNYWFWILIALQAIAIVFVLFRIAYPTWEYWPSELFAIAGSGALTWLQVKRFKELSAAFGLTAHEIGAIRGELESVKDDDQFSQFVTNSENAFSREHTQWISRKDI